MTRDDLMDELYIPRSLSWLCHRFPNAGESRIRNLLVTLARQGLVISRNCPAHPGINGAPPKQYTLARTKKVA